MSPSAAKVALGRQTSGLRMSRGGKVTVRTDVLGAIFSIVTCTRAPKAFSKGGSGATSNRDIEEASGGRDYWTIIANLHDKGLVVGYCIFIQAIFWVDSSEGGGDIRWSRGEQLCK